MRLRRKATVHLRAIAVAGAVTALCVMSPGSAGAQAGGSAEPADAAIVLTDLGTLGGDSSAAAAINEASIIVGGSQIDTVLGTDPTHAFAWSEGDMVDLTAAPGDPYYGPGGAGDVNEQGKVVGHMYYMAGAADVRYWATVWDAATGPANPEPLGTLGGRNSRGKRINDSGQVIGDAQKSDESWHSFFYDPAGGTMIEMPGIVQDINNDGDVVGYVGSGLGARAAVWTHAGGAGTLVQTDLPGLGGGASGAMAANNSGLIAGYASRADGTIRAVIWSRQGSAWTVSELDMDEPAVPAAINDDGWVVGTYADGAFLYANGDVQNLNALAPASGWDLNNAYDINNRGQIVGSGIDANGKVRAYLLQAAIQPQVTGIVRDGVASHDHHDNLLQGIRVELLDIDGTLIDWTSTDENGRYALYGDLQLADPYLVRVKLISADEASGDSEFEIWHRDIPPVCANSDPPTEFAACIDVREEVPTSGETLTRDIAFSGEEDLDYTNVLPRGELADLANIYYQTHRYVGWATDNLTDHLGDYQSPLPVVISAFSSEHTRYGAIPSRIQIEEAHSSWQSRNEPADSAPVNGEWHEFAHHLAFVNVLRSSDCAGDVNHAGYRNPSTCDSLQEGLATFLPAVAWRMLTGDGSSAYAGFGPLESNGWKAWTTQGGWHGAQGTWIAQPLYREDLAVAALLWDLYDAEADEEQTRVVPSTDDPDGTTAPVTYRDQVNLALEDLWDILESYQPKSVVELRDALYDSPLVPPHLKNVTINLDGIFDPDVAPLDIPFLMHGFYPVRPEAMRSDGGYYDVLIAGRLGIPGDEKNRAIGRTDSIDISGGVYGDYRSPRQATPEGSDLNLKLDVMGTNGLPLPGATAHLAIEYPESTVIRDVSLPTGDGDLVFLPLPPHFRGPLVAGEQVPECDQENDYAVTVTITVSLGDVEAAAPATLDNCEFTQAALSSDDPFALERTFDLPVAASLPGDVNCSGAVDAVDGLAISRFVAGLAVNQAQPCPAIGSGTGEAFGDVDCSGSVTAVDALFVLRSVAGLPVSLPPGCGTLGTLGRGLRSA